MTSASDAYRRALLEAPERHFDQMGEEMEARGLGHVPTLPQPLFLPEGARAQLAHICQHLHLAMEALASLYFDDHPEVTSWIPLHERAHPLIQRDAGAGPILCNARFDCVYDPESGQLSLLECNAGDPSGAGYTDAFLSAIMQLPAMQSTAAQWALTTDRLVRSHGQWVSGLLAEQGKVPQQLRWRQLSDDAAFVHADHRMIVEEYRALGIDIDIADPRELRYDQAEGRLFHGEQAIDVILRDTIDELILAPHWPGTAPILQAHEAGHVDIFNPFHTVIADYKGLMEGLSDPRWHQALAPETRAVLQQVVPWTRLVAPREVHFQGVKQPMRSLLQERQSEFVLKPNEGYGGFGVLLGDEVASSVWCEALEEAMAKPGSYVAQLRLPLPTDAFVLPTPTGDGFACYEKKVTLSFWTHGEQFAGCFARTSDASIINVHQGGALLPVCFAAAK